MDKSLNKPLKHDDIRALEVKKHPENGTTLISFEHPGPNMQQRRAYKKGVRNNAKNTAGRRTQVVEITMKQTTKFGEVNVPIGYLRKIVHKIAESRIIKQSNRHMAKLFAKKNL